MNRREFFLKSMLGLASLGFLFGFKKSNNEDDMKSKLEKLLDIEEIKKLKYRYFRGIDMADMELLESLFTDNASLDYRGGSYRWQVKGKKDILEQIANAFHSDALACHQGHHPEIEITGLNTAKGLWYLSDTFTDTKTQTTTRGSAIYQDQYVKESGNWKIKKSEYDRIWEEVEPANPETKIIVQYLKEHGKKLDDR
tara:strand:+ start:126 stop:716 length:591 start_codon:yes stop_codon:yes gene_type:complete